MSDPPFISPLRVDAPSALRSIDFGQPPPDAAVDALGARLAGLIRGLAGGLPAALRGEAEAVLDGYCQGRANFVALFYRPVWSFLHWVPVADPASLALASQLQAASLFLHLWDDHLSDGQLAPDLVRLHLRTLAWQAFDACAVSLCRLAGVQVAEIRALVDAYLLKTHRPGSVSGLDAHAERMVDQVGIWRAGPLLHGHLAAGPAGSAALCRVVERFSVAWRLIDDVQDAEADVATGQQSAVFLALDADGRRAWEACRHASAGAARAEPASWAAVSQHLHAGALTQVLDLADQAVSDAAAEAARQGWSGLAAELHACRVRRAA